MMYRYLKLFLLLIIPVLYSSCSRQTMSTGKHDNLVIYPAPPDTTRIQFLTSISTSQDITGQRNAFSRFVLGDIKPSPIVKPYGLALVNSKLYSCDATINGLEIIDFDKSSFEYFIPKGRGQLKMPVNCSVDTNGLIYVADAARKQIVVFDKEKQFLDAFAGEDSAKPTDVAIWGEKIFIPDAIHNCIKVYDKANRKFLYKFPDIVSGEDGYLYQPINITVDQNTVYVTDLGDSKIKSYSHTGQYISSYGSFGNSPGQFVRPKGIAVDKKGILYAVDAGFENVQMFNSAGQILMFFGGPYKGPGDMWLPAKVIVDYDHLKFFQKYVDPGFKLNYLIIVSNQYGPDKINIYGAVENK